MATVTISRSKLHQRAGRFAWVWCYSVTLPNAAPVTIGTNLATATSWAKQRAPGTTIVRDWKA